VRRAAGDEHAAGLHLQEEAHVQRLQADRLDPEDVAGEQGDKIKIVKLDVDANPITAGRFGVRAIPTMIVFKNGREADRIVGYHPKPQLMTKLNPHLTMAAPTAAATPPVDGSPTSSTPNAGVGVNKIH